MIQLGTRWGFGSTPPSRLSGEVVQVIADVERTLVETGRDDLREAMWTLTWLEGRPTAELDRDDDSGEPLLVSLDAAGRVRRSDASDADPNDEW